MMADHANVACGWGALPVQAVDGATEATVHALALDLVHCTPSDAHAHGPACLMFDLDVLVACIVANLQFATHVELHLHCGAPLPEGGSRRVANHDFHKEAAHPLVGGGAQARSIESEGTERRLWRHDSVAHAFRVARETNPARATAGGLSARARRATRARAARA